MRVNAIKLEEATLDPNNVDDIKKVLAQLQKYQTNPNINGKSFQTLINACNNIFNSENYSKVQASNPKIPNRKTAIKNLSNLNNVAQAISQSKAQVSAGENQKRPKTTSSVSTKDTETKQTVPPSPDASSTITSISQKLAKLTTNFTPEQKQQFLDTVKQALGFTESVKSKDNVLLEDIL